MGCASTKLNNHRSHDEPYVLTAQTATNDQNDVALRVEALIRVKSTQARPDSDLNILDPTAPHPMQKTNKIDILDIKPRWEHVWTSDIPQSPTPASASPNDGHVEVASKDSGHNWLPIITLPLSPRATTRPPLPPSMFSLSLLSPRNAADISAKTAGAQQQLQPLSHSSSIDRTASSRSIDDRAFVAPSIGGVSSASLSAKSADSFPLSSIEPSHMSSLTSDTPRLSSRSIDTPPLSSRTNDMAPLSSRTNDPPPHLSSRSENTDGGSLSPRGIFSGRSLLSQQSGVSPFLQSTLTKKHSEYFFGESDVHTAQEQFNRLVDEHSQLQAVITQLENNLASLSEEKRVQAEIALAAQSAEDGKSPRARLAKICASEHLKRTKDSIERVRGVLSSQQSRAKEIREKIESHDLCHISGPFCFSCLKHSCPCFGNTLETETKLPKVPKLILSINTDL